MKVFHCWIKEYDGENTVKDSQKVVAETPTTAAAIYLTQKMEKWAEPECRYENVHVEVKIVDPEVNEQVVVELRGIYGAYESRLSEDSDWENVYI